MPALDIRLLHADAVVPEPDCIPQLIEEPAGVGRVRLMRLLDIDNVVTIHRKHAAEWRIREEGVHLYSLGDAP